ncbi:MAG: OsmC family protein [Bacteroidetes bacterium]|nr:OsmC family protein [Bacteroidota bacterium]
MSHHVSTSHNEGMSFTAHIDNHTVIMDSHDDPIQQKGPSPKRLMLASLAGCTGIDIVSILDKMKVRYSDFTIDITATLTTEHPKIYNHVTIIYKIKLEEVKDQAKMEKAIQLSQDKYCGVSAMFKAFAKVETKTEYL